MKTLRVVSKLNQLETKVNKLSKVTSSTALPSREQYIEYIDSLRNSVQELREEIANMSKMDSGTIESSVSRTIDILRTYKESVAFNLAMLNYDYNWLQSLPDPEYAYKLCVALTELFKGRSNPDWEKFLNENTF